MASYDEEFKKKVVRLHLGNGRTVRSNARKNLPQRKNTNL